MHKFRFSGSNVVSSLEFRWAPDFGLARQSPTLQPWHETSDFGELALSEFIIKVYAKFGA